MSKQDYAAKWSKDVAKVLVGRTIVGVEYLTDMELDALGWHERSVVLKLDDGNAIIASRDDEGNGAGALMTTFEAMPTIPVVPR